MYESTNIKRISVEVIIQLIKFGHKHHGNGTASLEAQQENAAEYQNIYEYLKNVST